MTFNCDFSASSESAAAKMLGLMEDYTELLTSAAVTASADEYGFNVSEQSHYSTWK